jgi:hypothetical protein
MKKALVTLFISLSSFIAYCQHPCVQGLQSAARITFPDTPKVEYSHGDAYYIYTGRNLYFAEVIDLGKITRDSLKASGDIYAEFTYRFIKRENGSVFYSENIEVHGLKGVAYNFKCNIKGGTYYGYQQIFHLKDQLIGYILLSPDSLKKNDKKITSFFDTFKLTPQKAADSEKQSRIMAAFLIVGSMLFWFALAIYLIKKFNKKKKKYEWPDGT